MAEQNRKHIVMFSAEAAPFVKVGGLADVVGALPKFLEKLGVQVSVVLPAYQAIARGPGKVPPVFLRIFESRPFSYTWS